MRRTLSACVIAGLGVGLSAVPASAAYTDCPTGYACLWTSESYPGSPNGWFYSNLTVTIKVNSIVNNGRTSVARFYDKDGYWISLNNPARGGQWRDPRLSNGTDAQPGNWSGRIVRAAFI